MGVVWVAPKPSQVCRKPASYLEEHSAAALSRQDENCELTEASRGAAPSHLCLCWCKATTSPKGHKAAAFALVSSKQEQGNDFTGFIQNRRRKSFLYRHHETDQHNPQFCLWLCMSSSAHSPSPPLIKHGSNASAPHLFSKSTQQLR